MNKQKEISGDEKMTPLQRIEYLWRNLVRNLKTAGVRPGTEYISLRSFAVNDCSSPGRLLTELHLRYFLPALIPVGRVRVLDIGCGSGRLCRILSELGYSGEYVGLDVQDRFGAEVVPGFVRRFILGDAHKFKAKDSSFDLIVSVSALEHIPNERKLLDLLPTLLTPQGVELHFVPSGWGLAVYLWHGYRQYSLRYISEVFGHHGVRVFALGGGFSFSLHLILITIGEILLRIPIRNAVPRFYKTLLRTAFFFDRYAKVCPTMFAVSRARP